MRLPRIRLPRIRLPRIRLRSATTRLIAIHLVLVALSTAAVLAFVYVSTRNVIESQVREVVGAELRGLADDYATGGVLGLARAIERRLAGDLGKDGVYLLADRHGRRIAGNLGGWPPVVPAGGGWVEVELYRSDRDRAAVIAAAALPLEGGERLLVGRDSQAQAAFRRTLLGALGWALAVSGLLALASGWFISRFVNRRVAEVVATAEEIVQGDMARRVPVRGAGDEFDRLAATLNRMLDRIQLLVGDLRMVTDGLAHDLRSPLTRLRAHLDASLEEGLDETARRERQRRAVAEAEGVLRTFAALTEIARAEAGVGRDQFEAIELGRLADDVIDLYTPSAAERGVRLVRDADGPGEVIVQGHKQLLANAVANLVENAVAHAPAGSEVSVAVHGPAGGLAGGLVGGRAEGRPSGRPDGRAGPPDSGAGIPPRDNGGGPALTVVDRGPGIPATERDRVMQRFVRLDASRGRPGAGLGLSLVVAVARLHGAALELGDNAPGLRATLRFGVEGDMARSAPRRPV